MCPVLFGQRAVIVDLLFGGQLSVLVVVWWSCAVFGSSSGVVPIGARLGVWFCGLLWFLYHYLYMYLFKCVLVSCRVVSCGVVSSCVVSSRLVSSRLVSSRLVSSRLVSCRVVSCRVVSCRVVSSCLVLCFQCGGARHSSEVSFEIAGTEQLYQARWMIRGLGNVFFWTSNCKCLTSSGYFQWTFSVHVITPTWVNFGERNWRWEMNLTLG